MIAGLDLSLYYLFLTTFCPKTILSYGAHFEQLLNQNLHNKTPPLNSRDVQIFVFFPFLSTLSRFKWAIESGIIYDVINWIA